MTVKRILILEDNDIWIDNIKTIIEYHNTKFSMEIDSAKDCMEGMKKLIDDDYDLLISDVQINGVPKGLCPMWVSGNLKKRIPVIVVSGQITREQVLESVQNYNISADDIFLKGNFNKKEFLERVFAKLEDATDPEHAVENQNIKEDMETRWRYLMRWILFWVFISLFVIIVLGTLGMLFFDFGRINPDERSLLITGFALEIGVCVTTLFYSMFNIKKNR